MIFAIIPSFIWKILAITWVGGIILFGLTRNGDRLMFWLSKRLKKERDEMHVTLDRMFIEINSNKLMRLFMGYLALLFFLGNFFLYPHLGAGFCFGVFFVFLGWKVPLQVLRVLWKNRVKKFVLQMVDGLSLMSNAMRSGLNVPQALQVVADELSNPIAQEFGLVLSQNKLGVTFEEALSNLSVRMPHDDIEMFTTAINILKETGGNLAETFDSISHTIRERIKIESKISAMTAQGVFQGIVIVLMPFALGIVLYTIDPERIRPMFTTVVGLTLLTVMVILHALGALLIWRIVKVRV